VATARQRQHHPTLIAWNETRQKPLVEHGRLAHTAWQRGRGLLGTASLPPGDGLLIEKCSSIHSFWMRYAFDALFLDREGRVVHLIREMKPHRISRHVFAAKAVLELPAGTIRATGSELGDVVRWRLQSDGDPA
jgi:uncharacterized protein